MSDVRFTIIDGDGGREVTAQEFEAHVRDLEANPKQWRIEHTPEELAEPFACGCLNCLDARARGDRFTASDLQTLADIMELPSSDALKENK